MYFPKALAAYNVSSKEYMINNTVIPEADLEIFRAGLWFSGIATSA